MGNYILILIKCKCLHHDLSTYSFPAFYVKDCCVFSSIPNSNENRRYASIFYYINTVNYIYIVIVIVRDNLNGVGFSSAGGILQHIIIFFKYLSLCPCS